MSQHNGPRVVVIRFRKEQYHLARANVPEAERCRIFEAFDSSEVVVVRAARRALSRYRGPRPSRIWPPGLQTIYTELGTRVKLLEAAKTLAGAATAPSAPVVPATGPAAAVVAPLLAPVPPPPPSPPPVARSPPVEALAIAAEDVPPPAPPPSDACPICLENLDDASPALACDHRFHAACVKELVATAWADGAKRTRGRGTAVQCPLCRGQSYVRPVSIC